MPAFSCGVSLVVVVLRSGVGVVICVRLCAGVIFGAILHAFTFPGGGDVSFAGNRAARGR